MIQWHRDSRFPFDRFVRFFPFEKINDAMNSSRNCDCINPVIIF